MNKKVNVFIVKNFILERMNNDEDTKQKRNNPIALVVTIIILLILTGQNEMNPNY